MTGRAGVVVLMVAGVVAAACTTGTDPVSQGEVRQIVGITTSAHAAASDTIRIAFSYVIPPCDSGATLEVRDENDADYAGVRFTARSHTVDAACPLGPTLPHAVAYLIAPPHFAPMKLIFSEPDGNDTVRVVGP